MKSDSLLKIDMVSGVRKNLLYKLTDGPMSLTEIREYFNVTSSNVIPRIKDLVKMDLVVKEDGRYVLTSTGMILSKKLRTMDSLAEIIGKGGKFLNEHDLSPIVGYPLDSIDELGDCQVISNGVKDMAETHDLIYKNLSRSKFVLGISPAFNSAYPEIYQNMAAQGIPVSLIVTEQVFKKLEADPAGLLEPYLRHDNAKLYVVENVRMALVVTSDFLSMYLYKKNGAIDAMNSLMSFEESATKWGIELFEEYK